ncbi:Spy/CpxP family protein refolding chaperone [Acetobacter persici]|uniref:Spy/CpxP family protein refolding chaperone n=1 Tax=Acetobacter persici TaxID=1076596 RepID=UPI0036D9FE7F
MMKKALLATALTLGMLTTAGAAAYAEETAPPPPPPPGACHPPGPVLNLDGVKLTSAQKKKIKAILDANRPDPKADMAQDHALHDQIRTLLTTPGQVDTDQLNSLTQQIGTLHAQHEAQRLQTDVQIHDVLTKKQLKQIAEKKDEPPCPPGPPMMGGNPPPPPPPPGADAPPAPVH